LFFIKQNDDEFVMQTVSNIQSNFKEEIDNGFLEIITPSKDYYPSYSSFGKQLKDTVFKDTSQRIKWRTKQNYDIIFLMSYAMNKGIYYLQVINKKKEKKFNRNSIKSINLSLKMM
jgi:alpha-1,3-mannosylglycoprotein beta-1,4-N-acetylglucosaminyltransferase A/B